MAAFVRTRLENQPPTRIGGGGNLTATGVRFERAEEVGFDGSTQDALEVVVQFENPAIVNPPGASAG